MTTDAATKQEILMNEINEAAKHLPDMNVPDDSQPEDDADDVAENTPDE